MLKYATALVLIAHPALADTCDRLQSAAEDQLRAHLSMAVAQAQSQIIFSSFASGGGNPETVAENVSSQTNILVADAVADYFTTLERNALVCSN